MDIRSEQWGARAAQFAARLRIRGRRPSRHHQRARQSSEAIIKDNEYLAQLIATNDILLLGKIKAVLSDNDIAYVVINENAANLLGFVPDIQMELLVSSDDLPRCNDLIEGMITDQ